MKKILVIDDEDSIRLLLGVSLSHKGYKVYSAENGTEGIASFRKYKPEIVLTDLKMPGIDGMEVLKEIKHINPDTRVIVITGHGEMESAVTALQMEASDFINKPITDKALTVALKRAEEVLWLKQKVRAYTNDLEKMVREATEELRSAYEFQNNLIQSSIDGIIADGEDGYVVVFNEGAQRLTGYLAEEVISKKSIDIFFTPEEAESIRKKIESKGYGGKGRLVNSEETIVSKEGEKIPVRISGIRLVQNGGKGGVVCFFQDLREIKRLQKELIENERISAIGQAVAGMAHYIKNILNGLQGGVYMVNTSMKRARPELMEKGWAMVQNNIGKISNLVMNMLAYSREREPDRMLCDPNHIVDEVCDLFHMRARQANVELVKDLDDSMVECLLDQEGTYRSLLNLVSNAIDACMFDDTCTKKKRCVVIGSKKEENTIRFDVADNGTGMSAETQKRLFERFFTTKGGKGTGLGLLVTQKIVDEQGGTISFDSALGRGTVFTLRFPLKSEDINGLPVIGSPGPDPPDARNGHT